MGAFLSVDRSSFGSLTGLEHGQVAQGLAVMLGLFLQHHLEAAAHDILLVGIGLRRLATASPIKLGLGEPLDDAPHRGHAKEPRREHLVKRRGGFERQPQLCCCVGRHPAGRKAQRVVRRFVVEQTLEEDRSGAS